MFFQITFHDIWTSQPEVFQNSTLANLASAAQVASGGMQLFRSASNLSQHFSGPVQQAQQSQAMNILNQGQQVITALTTTANTINSTAQVMKAAKARLVSIVAVAEANGLRVDKFHGIVFPTGDQPRAAALAARLNQQIQTVIFQVNAHDAQVKLSLAATAMDAVSFVMNAAGLTPSGSDAASGLPTTTIPSPTTTSGLTTTGSASGLTETSTSGALTAAAPGSGTGYGLSGVSGFTGAGDQTGAGGTRAAMLSGAGISGAAAALSGVGAGAAGGGAVMVGRAGTGSGLGMGMVPVGAAGGAAEQRETTGWKQLTEDEDIWSSDDIPDTNDGVLA